MKQFLQRQLIGSGLLALAIAGVIGMYPRIGSPCVPGDDPYEPQGDCSPPYPQPRCIPDPDPYNPNNGTTCETGN